MRHTTSWSLIFVLVAITLAISFGTAYAGLFSFLSPVLEEASAASRSTSALKASTAQTMALLDAATNIDPNPNKPGNIAPIADNVLVPDIALSNGSDKDETSTEINTYIVREGDTASGIAEMFHVSLNTVLWANDLTSKSVLRAGQTLVILPVSGTIHVVKKGDTVSEIAKKYGADANEIIAYNDLTISSLTVGQSIIIPNGEISTVSAASSGSKPSSSTGLINTSTKLPNYSGYYIRPIRIGRVSQGIHGHNGVDFAAPVGTPIFASAAGTVIINRINNGWNGGYGNFVVISHSNGTQTLYAHMQLKAVVSAGEVVGQGELIGYIGMSGQTTGPHVHFEIRGAKNPF